jgi:hypothetical protein
MIVYSEYRQPQSFGQPVGGVDSHQQPHRLLHCIEPWPSTHLDGVHQSRLRFGSKQDNTGLTLSMKGMARCEEGTISCS